MDNRQYRLASSLKKSELALVFCFWDKKIKSFV